MPTPTTWPSAKQFLNWGVEATQGVQATTTTWTNPVDSFTPRDVVTGLPDKAMRGSMVDQFGYVQGPIHTEFDMAGPAYLDGLGFLLKNILGDLTTTGAGAPFTHAFSTLNSGTAQPSSLTLVHWQGMPATTNARMYTGACLSELILKGNPETTLVEMTAKGVAYPSADFPTTPPTSAPTTAPALAAWRTAIGIGGPASGGTLVKTIRDWQITITREVRVQHTSQNSQSPFIIQRGKVAVTGQFAFTKPADETPLNYLLNNTQPQVQILVSNSLGGASLLSLQIDSQVSAFDTAAINASEEALGFDDTFIGIANTTNAGASGGQSPIKVTLQNAVTSGTY